MDEAVNRYNETFHNDYLSGREHNRRTRQNQCNVYAMTHDNGTVVCSDIRTNLTKLESFLPLFSFRNKTPEGRALQKRMFQNDVLRSGEKSFQSLCRLLNEHFQQRFQDLALERSINMIFSASTHISRVIPPTFDSIMDGDGASTKNINVRFSQKAVPAAQFYGSSNGRFDTVVVIKEAMENS